MRSTTGLRGPPSEDVASALIDNLVAEGEIADDGSFTLDPAAALAKLRAHQLDDPHAYLLLLVEAAWLAGHGRSGGEVRISLGPSTSITFHGLALAHGVLPDVFIVALVGNVDALDGEAQTQARILQLLGLAANAALALEPKRLEITTIDVDGRATRIEVTSAGSLTIEEPTDETLRPGSVRFLLDGVGRGRQRNQAEFALVHQRCRHTTLPVWVNGELVSRGLRADLGAAEPTGVVEAEVRYRDEVIGVAGHTADPGSNPQMVFVNRGVAIVEALRERRHGVQAVVEVDLPVDLSRKQLVEGAELEALRLAIRAAVTRLAPVAEPSLEDEPPAGLVFLAASISIVSVIVVVLLAGSGRSNAPRQPTRDEAARQEVEQRSAQIRAVSKEIESNALRIGCYGSNQGKSCALAAERTQEPVARDRLLIRGCTVQHDPDACQALVAAARIHASERNDLTPVGLALVQSCLGVAGPDCVEAARYLRLKRYPSKQVREFTYYLLREPIPDIGADELLARGCEAGVPEACTASE
jgi:hypothetical protein